MSTVLMSLQAACAKASDTEALSKILAAAFIADQTVLICSLDNPSFSRQTAGPRGTSRDYLEHIKPEILSSIPLLEARQIVIAAANITRNVGRSQVKQLSPKYPDTPALALKKWCNSDGIGIVRDFMAKHDSDHEQFLKEIAESKRPAM
jgi:hypothetical protein